MDAAAAGHQAAECLVVKPPAEQADTAATDVIAGASTLEKLASKWSDAWCLML
jgi:hypothetical protein